MVHIASRNLDQTGISMDPYGEDRSVYLNFIVVNILQYAILMIRYYL